MAGAHLSTKEEIEHYAKSVMHRLHDAVGSDAVQKALFAVLGEQSFTAGVAYGMTKGLVVGVWQLGLLFKTLAFAEYDDLKHGGTFWERMRRGSAQSTWKVAPGRFAISACGLPLATRRPRSRIARRWQRSASSM